MKRDTYVRNGVEEAFSFWLSQREITTQECAIEGVARAFRKWLDDNHEEVVDAIARAVADKQGGLSHA